MQRLLLQLFATDDAHSVIVVDRNVIRFPTRHNLHKRWKFAAIDCLIQRTASIQHGT